ELLRERDRLGLAGQPQTPICDADLEHRAARRRAKSNGAQDRRRHRRTAESQPIAACHAHDALLLVGIRDWGLGIRRSLIANPKSRIPNPVPYCPRPIPNWSPARDGWSPENTISTIFSLWTGRARSSVNSATIVLLWVSITSPVDGYAYFPSILNIIHPG